MTTRKYKKSFTPAQALEKLQRYCAYQDRCHEEVRTKLLDLGVYGDDLEIIISELIQEQFLDETRYAQSFARGKFRIKKWGKNKIKQALKRKKVSDYNIRKGLEEIDSEEYLNTINELIEKWAEKYSDLNSYEKRQKLYQMLLRKGYESEYIQKCLGV